MAKAKSRVLKMPLWQDIVYMALVLVGPIVVTCLELFESHSTPFKWSFASIGSLLVTVIIIRKYLFANKLKRYEQECYDLEHDYSIANGNDDLIIARWKKCKMILYAINALEVLQKTETITPVQYSIKGDTQSQFMALLGAMMGKYPSRRPRTAKQAIDWLKVAKNTFVYE